MLGLELGGGGVDTDMRAASIDTNRMELGEAVGFI